jgi:hypothetical protein
MNLFEMVESFKYYSCHFGHLGNSPYTLDIFLITECL